MVFSGRPSDACYPCRKGRLRCDRLQPGCTQCSRKSITCPGYRDLSDFYFRDETANAAFKVQNRKPRRRLPAKVRTQPSDDAPPPAQQQQQQQKKKKPAATGQIPVAGAQAGGTLVESGPSAVRCHADRQSREAAAVVVRYRNLSQPLKDLARTYFMVDYITSSPFEYLTHLGPHVLNGENALSAAISANAFASLSLKLNDDKLLKQARGHYANALCQTNQALGSPALAVQDATLAAVLLLGLFEAIVFTGQQSLDSWNAHTIGAVELLRLRGARQLETPLGRKLFVHAGNNIRTSCAHSKTPVPPRFLSLYEQVRPQLDHHDPFLRVAPVVDRVAGLRARAARLDDDDDDDDDKKARRTVVGEALALDAETSRLGRTSPGSWKFAARPPGEDAPLTYMGVSLRYPSLRALRYWNSLRIIRVFLNDVVWAQASVILDRCPDLLDDDDDDADYEAILQSARRNVATLVVEVLASCGEYIEPTEERFTVSARCLIWPLSVIAESPLTPHDARRFAVDCLERLRQDCRIPRADGVETHVRGIRGDWLHLYHLT